MSGTKVTKDSEALNNPNIERPGFVAKDSLAAESLNDDPSTGFAANDRNTAASSQGAHGSTASNTDTSGASTLDASRDGPQRGGGFENQSYDEVNDATRGLGKSEGRGPTFNTDTSSSGGGFGGASASQAGGTGGYVASGLDKHSGTGGGAVVGGTGDSFNSSSAQADYSSTGGGSGFGGGSGSGSGNSGRGGGGPDTAGTAPNYASSNTLAQDTTKQPKGANLKENEGFDGNEQNASFNTDIGGENDPSRLAETKFSATNAQSGYDAAGSGPRQGGVDNQNPFGSVGEEQA